MLGQNRVDWQEEKWQKERQKEKEMLGEKEEGREHVEQLVRSNLKLNFNCYIISGTGKSKPKVVGCNLRC